MVPRHLSVTNFETGRTSFNPLEVVRLPGRSATKAKPCKPLPGNWQLKIGESLREKQYAKYCSPPENCGQSESETIVKSARFIVCPRTCRMAIALDTKKMLKKLSAESIFEKEYTGIFDFW